MNAYSFFTLKEPAIASYKEKGSKFLAFAYPIRKEEDIKKILTSLKKQYFDASHHCFAWILGHLHDRYRSFDDGEPNHSAGDPILGQIRSFQLTNVLVVVVRYFGGTKLGVGGLIAAYKTAAESVLSMGIRIEIEVTETHSLTFPYESTTNVMRLVQEFDLKIEQQQFDVVCSMTLAVPLRYKDKLEEKIKRLQISHTDIHYL